VIYREYEGAVIDRRVAAALARAYRSADMAILAQHGTLVTGNSVPQVLVRALSFEWRCRKAWEVACMGKTGAPLADDTAQALAQHADEYGELLFEAYGREQLARDPELLR
jgi:ribulose-5-phosphate 4-epimerase/fuculose-1-phosphate aldolase